VKTEKYYELELFPGINRAALIVKPKKPFFDWLLNTSNEYDKPEDRLKPEMLDTEVPDSKHVYLIPIYDEDKQYNGFLKKHCIEIFNSELNGWFMDPDMWPKDRSWKEFKKWFEYDIQTMVYDMIPEMDIDYDD